MSPAGVPLSAMFDPHAMSLDQALGMALAQNPRMREAAARIQEAVAGADMAYSPFLPELNAGMRHSDYTRPVLPGGSFVPDSLRGGATQFDIIEVGALWMLCDFGRTSGGYGQAVSRERIAEMTRRRVAQAVAYETSHAYFQLLYAQSMVLVREQSLLRAQAVLDDTLAFREGGVAVREDVLRAEVEVSQSREDVVAARQKLLDARAALNLALGRSAAWPVTAIELSTEAAEAPPLEFSLALAAEERPEIAALRGAVAEAAYGVEAARGGLLPRVFVRGTVVGARSNGPIDGVIGGVGLHLEQPLYAGGRHRAAVRQDQARVAAATARMQGVLDGISHQVAVAHNAIATNRQRIELARVAVIQSTENLRLTDVLYQNGDARPTDMVDAETALVEAQTRYFTAVFDYLDGLAALDFATGGDQRGVVAATRTMPAAEPVSPLVTPPFEAPPAEPSSRREDG